MHASSIAPSCYNKNECFDHDRSLYYYGNDRIPLAKRGLGKIHACPGWRRCVRCARRILSRGQGNQTDGRRIVAAEGIGEADLLDRARSHVQQVCRPD